MDANQLKRLEILENRLHDHIEHYAQNNKTLALLQQRMDYFINRFEDHDQVEKEYNKRVDAHLEAMSHFDVDKAKELVDGYRGVLTIKNVLLGLAAVAVAMATIGAFFVTIIRAIK